MDYFKHYSTASEGNTLNHLMDKFGHQGYACWFLLLELCCANWDGKSEPKFNFFSTIVRKKLRISSTKLQVFLEYCSTISELSFNFSEKNLEIYLPMLAEIKETRGRISGNKPKKIDIYRIDKEEDKDIDKEGNKPEISLADYPEVTNVVSYNFGKDLVTSTQQIPLHPDSLIQLFNDKLAARAGKIKHCRGLSANQIKEFLTTCSYKEFQTVSVWEEIFEKVSKTPFLNGSKKGSNFVATLDWLIIHGNALKVINGKYQEVSEADSKEVSNQEYLNSVELS